MTVTAPSTWMRLNPSARDDTLAEGLQARVADPVWLLARQLAVGEYQGSDGGSPILTEVTADTSRLSRLRGDVGPSPAEPLPLPFTGSPLEALVEAEPEPARRTSPDNAEHVPARPIASALAGLHYLRLLSAADGIGDTAAYRAGLLQHYPLPGPRQTPAAGLPPPPAGTEPLLRIYAGRVPDGQALYADLQSARQDPPTLPEEPARGAAADDAVIAVATAWLDWYDATSGMPHGPHLAEHRTWSPQRMEYQVSLAAPGPGAETVLTATEYAGDGLDWWHFDRTASSVTPVTSRTARTLQATGEDRQIHLTALSAPVHYAGAPDPRWWTLEDASINFGDITAPAESTTTSVVIEYAIQYANDHHLIPLPLDVGTLCRVTALIVTDTFGQQVLVRPVAEVEPDGPFRLFEHTSSDPADPRDPLFMLFPAAVQVNTGTTLEEVSYGRDEIADVVWAVEATALGPLGTVVDRIADARPRHPQSPPPPSPPTPGQPMAHRYLVRTDVEENWYAFTMPPPARPGDNGAGTLMPFVTLPPLQSDQATPTPWGQVLAGQTGGIPAEEVTRTGATVARVWRSARGVDGRHYSWVARRTRPGRGSVASGLRWDLAP